MRASRRVFGAFLAVVVTVLGARSTAASQTFQHPGVLVSHAQLDYIKIMVAAHTEPFYSAFLKAQNSNIGALNYQIRARLRTASSSAAPPRTPTSAVPHADNDSSAAYLQALLWYITGNQQYADNAITHPQHLWHNLKGYTNSNEPLQAAWDGEKLPRAAEIIRYTNAGWADSDIQQFKTMLNTVILPRIINGSTSNGNWEISMIEGTDQHRRLQRRSSLPSTTASSTGSNASQPTSTITPMGGPRSGAPRHRKLVRSDASTTPASTASRRRRAATSATPNTASPGRSMPQRPRTSRASTSTTTSPAMPQAASLRARVQCELPARQLLHRAPLRLRRHRHPAGLSNRRDRLQQLSQPAGHRSSAHTPISQNTIRQLSNPTEYHIMVYETLSHGGDASFLQPFLMRAPVQLPRLFARRQHQLSRSTSFPAAIRAPQRLLQCHRSAFRCDRHSFSPSTSHRRRSDYPHASLPAAAPRPASTHSPSPAPAPPRRSVCRSASRQLGFRRAFPSLPRPPPSQSRR